MDARLIIDPPARGAWNMAVDEALFQTAQRSRQMTVRFYQWLEPTLTLGYFQPADDRRIHSPSRECPMVRRSTGGGAIVHDRELTYSLIAPIGNDRSAQSQEFVRIVHSALIKVLGSLGVKAFRYGDPSRSPHDTEPFLCFHRRAEDDVVIGQHKIAGSAQRRLHSTLLQHGSVLLGRSAAAPELPGIAEILETDLPVGKLLDAWVVQLRKMLGCRFQTGTRTSEEDRLADHVEQAKFASFQWNRKR